MTATPPSAAATVLARAVADVAAKGDAVVVVMPLPAEKAVVAAAAFVPGAALLWPTLVVPMLTAAAQRQRQEL